VKPGSTQRVRGKPFSCHLKENPWEGLLKKEELTVTLNDVKGGAYVCGDKY